MVARLLWEQDVAGSNPVIPTKKGKRLFLLPFLLGFQASMYATHTRILFAARGDVSADCSVNTTGNENLLARQYSFGMHSKNEKVEYECSCFFAWIPEIQEYKYSCLLSVLLVLCAALRLVDKLSCDLLGGEL